jgi:hypothetical protein
MLSGGAGRSLADSGSSMLSGLFGTGTSGGITDAIARYTGLSGGVTGKLLAMIAPLVFGALKKTKSSMGLDAGGLANLLSSQKGSFLSAMPSGLTGMLGNVPGLSGLMGSARSTAASAYEGARAHVPSMSRPSYGWVVPVCIVALLGLGLLWWWNSRAPQTAVAPPPPRTPAQQTTPAVAERANDSLSQGKAAADDAARTAGAQVGALRDQVSATTGAAASQLSQQTGGLSTSISDWFSSATKTFEGIKDNATAEAAIPKIDSFTKQLDTIGLSMKALPASTRTKLTSSIKEWRDKLKPTTDKVLAMPAVGDKVKPSIEGMYTKIDALIAE